MGGRGSGSTRFSGELAARAAGNTGALEGYGNQYWPICSSLLAWRTPLLDREGGHHLQGYKESDTTEAPCVHRHKAFFVCGSSAPVELSVKATQLLGLRGPWRRQACRDTDCLRGRSYGPIRAFFSTSCSWRSEGLQPIRALRGLPCLASFSVVERIRHIERPPAWGPTL